MRQNKFNLKSKYSPSPDQQRAIDEIVKNISDGKDFQTLWWVTWSWKTFTMANVIQKIQKPTLIIAHNKTLAAQLALEFKEFFPENSVHYFVSYYDYYQPEAYVAKTDSYIEKEATVNEEIDRLRHAATQDLLTRSDVIIVASVSCIYGIWDIDEYTDQIFSLEVWKSYKIEDILKKLILIQYKRAWADFKSGNFQILWDILEIFPASSEFVYTIEFWWDEISQITLRNHLTWEIYEFLQKVDIFPAKHTVTTKSTIEKIVPEIKKELEQRLKYFESVWDVLKYERLKAKVEYDIEMMQEVGYVNGIENYSRYIDWRQEWEPGNTLIDCFPKDFLTFVDESHMTFWQIWWMYAGDRSRKENLVEHWFRLPSALDNRPLKFDEFEGKMNKVIAVSATPAKYEIEKSSNIPEKFFSYDPARDGVWQASAENRVIPQIMRPTGLLDPEIELRPMEFMVDDIMKNISEVVEKNERILITTITKRSSEELTEYLLDNWVKVKYLHSEVDTLDRLEILKELRLWKIDVIVWVNLLREGLDLPEVSKICILDADKQGFLRSESSLIQIIWRAARNQNGKVYMYCEKVKLWWEKWIDFKKLNQEYDWLYRLDKGKLLNSEWFVVSEAMRKAINMTYYRRNLQEKYNEQNWIIPKTVFSEIKDIWIKGKEKEDKKEKKYSVEKDLKRLELDMDIASANMDFEKAIELRDLIIELKTGKKRK